MGKKPPPTDEEPRAAIPHIAHDMLLLRQAWEHRRLRIAWPAWYVMARNVAIFLELPNAGAGKTDIQASTYFAKDAQARARWAAEKAARLLGAPDELRTLKAHASQAAAHLSWNRVRRREVQPPSDAVSRLLLMLWADFVRCLGQPYKQLFLDAWAEFHPAQRRRRQGVGRVGPDSEWAHLYSILYPIGPGKPR